jgi:transcription elongation GreA/GreB family factor
MAESEVIAALGRASRRAAYHLAKAGVEALKAVEAFLDELNRAGKVGDEEVARPVRIDLE